MNTNLLPAAGEIDAAWHYIETKIFNRKTNLLYDRIIKNEEDFPTPEECEKSWPNPCGYGTNTEDGMINAGTMLSACVHRYEKTKEKHVAEFAYKIAEGMISCADSAKTEGFLPRSVMPRDGVSHFIDSSRDQYTMFIYGAHQYFNSSFCKENQRKRLGEALVRIARRAEKNVTPENKFDLLRDDGGKTLNNTMWGPSLGNHEICRLPMIYMAAWEASGDAHWLNRYQSLRKEAIERSLPMTGYGQLYTVQQMQASLKVCYDLEPDKAWKEKYIPVMKAVADYANNKVKLLRPKLPGRSDYNEAYVPFRDMNLARMDRGLELIFLMPEHKDAETFFLMQDAAIVLIVSKMLPSYEPLEEAVLFFKEAYEKFDFNLHTRALPIHFMDAYFSWM